MKIKRKVQNNCAWETLCMQVLWKHKLLISEWLPDGEVKAAFRLEVHVYRPKGCVFPVYRAAALWAAEMQQFTRSPGSDHTQRRRGEFISPHRAFKALWPYPSPRKPRCFTGCLGRRRSWRRDAPTPHSYCTEPKVCDFFFFYFVFVFNFSICPQLRLSNNKSNIWAHFILSSFPLGRTSFICRTDILMTFFQACSKTTKASWGTLFQVLQNEPDLDADE